MERSDTSRHLLGEMLIAMPGMGDPRFDRSVVLICEDGPDSTMGLIVNKPFPGLDFPALLEQVDIAPGPDTRALPVHFGGPVDTGRGFVLHSAEYRAGAGTLEMNDSFAMTATRDVLEEMAAGGGPERALMALGYAGWGPGQLQSEILANAWLTCPSDADVVFGGSDAGKWGAALGLLGIDPLTLSASAGRA